MKRILFVGGGHAHLLALFQMDGFKDPDIEVVLVTQSQWQYYSGMLPGWISGEYKLEQCRIDVRPIVERAGARLVLQSVTGINADARTVELEDGSTLDFDFLSIDIGSGTNTRWAGDLDNKLFTVKPLNIFQAGWSDVLKEASEKERYDIVVVGGGAAGVEIAMVGKAALSKVAPNATVTLVAGTSPLMPGHVSSVRRKAERSLKKLGVTIIRERAQSFDGEVVLEDGRHLHADRIIAATGPHAAGWLQQTGLELDKDGFIAVDEFQRSRSHPNIFAAGDIASRKDPSIARSGVHAVRAGPIIAHNLVAAAKGQELKPYKPRPFSLYILASGEKTAIASWGPFSAAGRWVWRWKDHLDTSFMDRVVNA